MLKALDLFCGAGGATKGLQDAGFHVTGVDIAHQRNYVGDVFHPWDVLSIPPGWMMQFDLIWASPPADLIDPTRALLKATGVSYVLDLFEPSFRIIERENNRSGHVAVSFLVWRALQASAA